MSRGGFWNIALRDDTTVLPYYSAWEAEEELGAEDPGRLANLAGAALLPPTSSHLLPVMLAVSRSSVAVSSYIGLPVLYPSSRALTFCTLSPPFKPSIDASSSSNNLVRSSNSAPSSRLPSSLVSAIRPPR